MRKLVMLISILLILTASIFGGCTQAIDMPILMYHNVVMDEEHTSSMSITLERFAADLDYIQELGYTTLLPADILAIEAGEMQWPQKPIMITFDDGYYSNYLHAYPLLCERDMKAVICVQNSFLVDERQSQPEQDQILALTWAEVAEMAAGGNIEIGSHTYDLHNREIGGNYSYEKDYPNGIDKAKDENNTDYTARLTDDINRSVAEITERTGFPVNCFAYPYGVSNRDAANIIRALGIPMTFSTNPEIAQPAKSIELMPRFSINMDTDLAEILN